VIVEIRESYAYVKDLKEDVIQFFKSNGTYAESDGYQSDADKAAGIPAPRRAEFRFIGHIQEVPHHILNEFKHKIEYYRSGVQAFVQNAFYQGDWIKTKEGNMGVVNIHLPSFDLFQITDTLLLEDSCTDLLQGSLDNGWRIIACIPRPGQRRPDYILGKNSTEKRK
jgi:hypothetical protein